MTPAMGSLRAEGELARALSAVERGEPVTVDGVDPGHTIGVVGAPGAGKSTLISALVGEIRRSGRTVAVLAVDPSSPVSGGALLGDRIRMAEHAQDRGVFLRSFANRGHPGGLSAAIPGALAVTRRAGWDVVIVEPVGGGQADTAVAACTTTVVLVLSPESGDEMQIMKAGILELADIVVVNKADRPGAEHLHAALRRRWSAGPKRATLLVEAISGAGIHELSQLIERVEPRRPPLAASGRPPTSDDLAEVVTAAVSRVRATAGVDAVHDRLSAARAAGSRTRELADLLLELSKEFEK